MLRWTLLSKKNRSVSFFSNYKNSDVNFLLLIVFDPNIEIDIANPEYVTIHNEYKNLVSFWTRYLERKSIIFEIYF